MILLIRLKKIYNFKFRIPTKEQFEELIKYTKNYWVKNYNPNKLVHNQEDDDGIQGLNGRIFEGKNGNQMFIPATGYRDSDIYDVGSFCHLWSSELDLSNPYDACYLCFDSDYIGMNVNLRYLGFCVHPVFILRTCYENKIKNNGTL